jgi:hypothetical protein
MVMMMMMMMMMMVMIVIIIDISGTIQHITGACRSLTQGNHTHRPKNWPTLFIKPWLSTVVCKREGQSRIINMIQNPS